MRRLLITLVVLSAALPCFAFEIHKALYPRGGGSCMVAASNAPTEARQSAKYLCDGTADDVQIQTALTAAATAGGGEVRLSAGTFALATVIKIGDNVTLSGQGDVTLLDFANHTTSLPVIANSNHASGVNSGIVIRDLKIDGNSPNQASWTSGYNDAGAGNRGCVNLRNVSNFKVLNVTLYQPYCSGIEMEGCSFGVISGNRIDDNRDDGIGVNMASRDIVVTGNLITDMAKTAVYGGPSGIEVQDGSSNITVANNVIKHTGANDCSGIQVNDHSGAASNTVTISGNIISKADAGTFSGINLAGSDPAAQVYNIAVIGNSLSFGGTGRAFTLLNAKSVTIKGNLVYNSSTGAGVRSSGGTNTNITVDSNIFNDAGSSSSSGISAGTSATNVNWIITNNQFIGAGMAAAIAMSSSSGTYTNWLFRGNIIAGPQFAFRYNSGGTYSNIRVIDNHLDPDSYIAYDDAGTVADRQPWDWEFRGNTDAAGLAFSVVDNEFRTMRNSNYGTTLTVGMVVVSKSKEEGAGASTIEKVDEVSSTLTAGTGGNAKSWTNDALIGGLITIDAGANWYTILDNTATTIEFDEDVGTKADLSYIIVPRSAGCEMQTTTTEGDPRVVGVLVDASVANKAHGKVQTRGKVTTLKVDGTADIAIGDLLGTFTTAGIAMKAATGKTAFAIALEPYATDDSSGVIDALLITPRTAP